MKLTFSYSISKSENGWTDASLGLAWLKTVFDPETKAKAAGEPRVIVLDGHSSHYSHEFIQYARENNITLLGYPPHCTHALQGLDVVCFAQMKEAWKEEISRFETEHKGNVTKGDFTQVFGQAYIKSFTVESIRAAFEITGVHPYNPNVISEKQMKPSLTTSVKGSFPLRQPSPVKAVMAAFTTYSKDAFESLPSTPVETHQCCEDEGDHQSSLSKRRQPTLSDIDPCLFTPSKRMRALDSGLSATSSGSILVSQDKTTFSNIKLVPPVLEAVPVLPEPDWSLAHTSAGSYITQDQLANENERLRKSLADAQLQIRARDAMLEGSHAQLVVQDLTLQKTHQALFNRENRTKNDRSLLFDGKAQVLSSNKFRWRTKNVKTRP